MKLFVSCDEYCYSYKGEYYLSDNGMLFAKRYLSAFEKVRFFIRTKILSSSSEIANKHKVEIGKIEIIPGDFFQGPVQYAKSFFKIKNQAKKAIKDCDAAVFRLPSTTAFAALREWYSLKKPYAVEIVFDCLDAVENSTSFFERTLWRRLHKWQVEACRRADGVSCVTKSHLQRNYFSLKINSFTSNYSSIELTPNFYYRPRKWLAKNSYTIVHVARQVQFNGVKGHNELIKVIADLKNNNFNTKLIFIGEDYFNGVAKLTELAKNLCVEDNIEFAGFLNKNELREKLIHADLAVLPTKAEGLPRVIIEAMALGLPCITSPVSGNPELIDADFLIDYTDIKSMSKAILRILHDKAVYESQSLINFERSKDYSSEILNHRRKDFYINLKNVAHI